MIIQRTQSSTWFKRAMIVGCICLLLSLIGAFFNTKQFFISYLFGYLVWLGLALGCFTVTMMHHLTGGRWGYPIRRFLEAGLWTIPVMAILFIPLFFGVKNLYPWANLPHGSSGAGNYGHYMSMLWFIVRNIFYFLVWIFFSWRLRKLSLLQDSTENPDPTRKLINLSGPGIVLIPLTVTFAYIDWIMALEQHWYSTVFGAIILAGEVLAACAFAAILLKLFRGNSILSKWVRPIHYHQLGNLILAFVLFWTYVGFGQLLIIYSGNLPPEINWYLHRIAGGWKYVIGLIALFNFFLPFFLLLFRAFKTHIEILSAIAVAILASHVLYIFWLVQPSFYQKGFSLSWLDVTALLGIGGIWFASFIHSLAGANLIPRNDPRLKMELLQDE